MYRPLLDCQVPSGVRKPHVLAQHRSPRWRRRWTTDQGTRQYAAIDDFPAPKRDKTKVGRRKAYGASKRPGEAQRLERQAAFAKLGDLLLPIAPAQRGGAAVALWRRLQRPALRARSDER